MDKPSIFHDGPGLPHMAMLPPGTFRMGATADDKFADGAELPRHAVKIPGPFAVAIFPVTVAEWSLFFPAAEPASLLPVVRVSWDDAVEYTRRLTACTGRPYRLLTEEEWEYACRAGTETVFNTGSSIEPGQANFFYSEQGEKIGPGRLLPAGGFAPNAFGLYDMHGNVCEWVADAWRPSYSSAPAGDGRALRGGAWDHLPRLLRSAWRDWLPGGARLDNVGFRVAAGL